MKPAVTAKVFDSNDQLLDETRLKHLGPFEAFLFDCDGTLASTMAPHKAAWVEELLRQGVVAEASFIASVIDELAGMPAVQTVRVMNERFGWGLNPEALAASKEQLFLEKYAGQTVGIEPVMSHLRWAHGQGIKIAVVSGGRTRVVRHTLEQLQLSSLVSAWVCAEDVRFGKPHPEPFLMAAEHLGVAPKNCLVFEDASFGIQSARAAGMQWVRVQEV
jgi:HAD superfamily hydrolase (TIGR01509 family)